MNIQDYNTKDNLAVLDKAQCSLQMRFAEQYQDSCIEIEKARAKAEISKQNSLEVYEKKALFKEVLREYKEARTEEISISDEGGVILGVKNTLVNVGQRVITNLKRPSIEVFKLLGSETPLCYLLSGFVNEAEIKVFLASEKVGYGSYLLGKLARAGIRFYLPANKMKDIAILLIARLQENCTEITALPERDGWAKMEDGSFRFFGEEELNWMKIKELCK